MMSWSGLMHSGGVCSTPINSLGNYSAILSIPGLVGSTDHNRHRDGGDLMPLSRNTRPQRSCSARSLHDCATI